MRQEPSVSDNHFFDNRAFEKGGGVRFCYFGGLLPRPRVERNVIHRNTAIDGAGIHCQDVDSLTITECAIVDNEAIGHGGGMMIEATTTPGRISLERCTLVRNSASAGGSGMALADACTVDGDNTIIAFGLGAEAVRCEDAGSVAYLACSDIYGNQGGDWTGCIADQLGINGNFTADPLFCAPFLEDFTLAECSPCAPENSPAGCDLIGALPVGCVNPIGVAEETAPSVVGRLRVTPNPVRSGAMFTFDGIESPALEIYDPSGRLIDLLRPTGQSVTWLPGSEARSGVCFARLRGARGTQVVKFLVVR